MRLELPDLLAAGKDLHQLRHDRIHGLGHVAPDHLGMPLALAPVGLAAIASQRRNPGALERTRFLPQRLGQARLNDGLKRAVGKHGSACGCDTFRRSSTKLTPLPLWEGVWGGVARNEGQHPLIELALSFEVERSDHMNLAQGKNEPAIGWIQKVNL